MCIILDERGSAMDIYEECHFQKPKIIRDIIIGMADGLTVPFALAAGLAGSVQNTTMVVVAGLAEIAAGSIAMGLGGYLAVRSDAEHYEAELCREEREIEKDPDQKREEVARVFRQWGFQGKALDAAVDVITSDRQRWLNFMLKNKLGLEKPEPTRARDSSITIGLSYIAGGAIPLLPYVLIHSPATAVLLSVVVTLFALLVFGYIRGRVVGVPPVRSALQTTAVGGIAALVAYAAARWIA
jgi:VIT1/CCC1 family predicted Fe2+/Mn2+ transporter